MNPSALRRPCACPRRDAASFLLVVALLGLVATPLLHAEEHEREAHPHDEEAAALAREWEAGSRDSLDALAWALEHVHDPRQSAPARRPHHGHSHGPAGAPHGSGSLAHFELALHAAPGLPRLAPPPVTYIAPVAFAAQLRGTLEYLIPQWSQGPRPRC
jgi:hypothetical protein